MHIVIIDPSHICEFDGCLYLPERSYLGYLAYKNFLTANFPEIRLSVVALEGIKKVSNKTEVDKLKRFIPSEINLEKKSAYDFLKSLQEVAVVLALLKPESYSLADLPHRLVYIVEFTPSIRRNIHFTASGVNFTDRIRVNIGLSRRHYIEKKIIKKAAGIQFNGIAAKNKYSKYTENSLTFFDHRVTERADKNITSRDSKNKFSIAFSGRLNAMKGSRYIASISQKLYEAEPSINFFVMGDGEDREKILQKSAPNLIYKGFMEYKDSWEPFVRDNIDIMIFPHPQGDPSMTYYESLGQGVPILAFSNETSDYLASQGLGWTVPRGDYRKMVEEIIRLAGNPEEVKNKSSSAIDFMSNNLYDQIVVRRMNQLVSIAKSGE